jgi:hypothetical protein
LNKSKVKYIVGAYATAPSLVLEDKNKECEFYEKLTQSIPEIRGLEIPFWGENIHLFGADFLLKYIQPKWENVLTCIPASVMGLKKNRHFGIASNNNALRIEAVEMHKRANRMVHRINSHFGKKSIIAVQIASAPSMSIPGVINSTNSLLKSMREILSWDWMGAKIVIEHCDSCTNKNTVEKGFMSINNEIESLLTLSSDYKVGLTLNWARSAIEGRSPLTVIEHIKLASENNLLSGIIFSGVSINDEMYGEWKDLHMPFAPSYGIKNYESNSLLTKRNIKKTLESLNISELDYVGFKLLSMPINNSSIERRVGINQDAASVLSSVLSEIKLD